MMLRKEKKEKKEKEENSVLILPKGIIRVETGSTYSTNLKTGKKENMPQLQNSVWIYSSKCD